MNKKSPGILFSFLFLGGILYTSCSDDSPQNSNKTQETINPSLSEITQEIYYANMFGKDIMSTYYFWNKEINSDLENWNITTNNDPIGTVDRIKYHQGNEYIDKWSMLTNDISAFNNSAEGISTTFGWNLTFYITNENDKQYIGVINFVHDGSPAAKAGLKRGDIILTINNQIITPNNYQDLYNSPTLTVSLGKFDTQTKTITDQNITLNLNAVTMYENPIICDSIYKFNGKKVGYLAYSSFDLKSINKLIEIGKKFKKEGIKELILDLRYNGGGYVITENVLASMFAPQEAVSSGKIFEKEIYNDFLTQALKEEGEELETHFTTEFKYDDVNINVSTQNANIGLEKIYGLISSGSASASEALLGGLMPYLDIQLIGTQSHGKYCTGWILSAENIYEKCPVELKNWGIYIMTSIYQNADGKTPCRPNGLIPDIKSKDEPLLPYQLGDVNETLLRQALMEAGRTYDTNTFTHSRNATTFFRKLPFVRKSNFGMRIQLPHSHLIHH